MKFLILFVAICASALALPATQAPQSSPVRKVADPSDVQVVRYENNNIGLDSYHYVVETNDGTVHEQSGQLKTLGPESVGLAQQGQFSYVGPDGVKYTVTYIADENGFQPQGAHLPVAP